MVRHFHDRQLRDVAGVERSELNFLDSLRDTTVCERIMRVVVGHDGGRSDCERRADDFYVTKVSRQEKGCRGGC